MAKLQRWRRRGAVAEETAPDETPEETASVTTDVPESPDPGHEDEDETAPAPPPAPSGPRRSWRDSTAFGLLRAAHPKQGVAIALAVLAVAVLAGRPAREAAIVLATVLTGQAILGWHNDLVDRARDRAHQAADKPIAEGRVSVANAWFALALAVLLLVPLAITTGITAGLIYLASVALGVLGNVLFRTTPLSWWSWAASFALLPAYVSYGGWGGQAVGDPPETAMTVLAALAGVGVHLVSSSWGLVADHQDGWDTVPLKLGLRLGATRLLMVSSLYLAAVLVAMAVVGTQVGLTR